MTKNEDITENVETFLINSKHKKEKKSKTKKELDNNNLHQELVKESKTTIDSEIKNSNSDLNNNKEEITNSCQINKNIKRNSDKTVSKTVKSNSPKKKVSSNSIIIILKLQEFIQSIYNILKEQQANDSLLENIDSITEEWLEILYELIYSLKEGFSILDSINLKKYFILQQSFNVILFQCPIELNEKLINSILLSINMFEQNNYLLLGFIIGTFTFNEQADLFINVSSLKF